MKLTKLNSDKLAYFNPLKYKVDWNRKVSGPQKLVKDFLRKYWEKYIICEEAYIPGSLLRIDLLNLSKRIIVEVSPDALHTQYNKFLHGSRSGFLKKIRSDVLKSEWAEKNGFIFIELYDKDIENISVKYLIDQFGVDIR